MCTRTVWQWRSLLAWGRQGRTDADGADDSVEWFVGRGWGVLQSVTLGWHSVTDSWVDWHPAVSTLVSTPSVVYDILGCRKARFGVCTCLSVCPNGKTMLVASCTRSPREKKINCWTRRPLTEKSGKILLGEKKWGKTVDGKKVGKKSCWRKESGKRLLTEKKWEDAYAFHGKEIKEDCWRKRSGKKLLTEKKRERLEERLKW